LHLKIHCSLDYNPKPVFFGLSFFTSGLPLYSHSYSIYLVELLLSISIIKLSDTICMLGFVGVFYYLPNVNDFIVEILIGSVNSQVIHVLF